MSLAPEELSATIQGLLPRVRRNLSAVPFPSDYDPVVPLNIESALQTAVRESINLA